MNNISLVAHSCDNYEFCWKGFFHFFDLNFKHDIPKYFLSEDKIVSQPGWKNIRTGTGEWSDRLRIALNQIPTDYVIYVQEDAWPYREMPTEIIEKAFEFFNKRNANAVYLTKTQIDPRYGNLKLFDAYKEHNIYSFYRDSSYIMNHQFGIWKRSALFENLHQGESPWTNEPRATKRISVIKEHDKYYCFDYAWYETVVRRGKFTNDGENMLKMI